MAFIIGKSSDVELESSKINFYEYTLDKIGLILKDLAPLSGREMITLFDLIQRLSDKKENQIDLSDEDMVFIKKYIGDIK